jgi:hypothetical protein
MIHIATVHWNTARWLALQQAFLRRHLPEEFRIYAWLNNIPEAPIDGLYYVCREPVDQHGVKLNLLADMAIASATGADDPLIFLDGDAFPVASLKPLIDGPLPTRKLIAVQRLENSGDIQPHPCFCITTTGFWKEIGGDWKPGHQWLNRDGKLVSDEGGNLLKQLTDRRVDWLPLLRTNKVNLHPLFFGVYGEVIYHHGAGFRKGECRADDAKIVLPPAAQFLSKLVPGYKRHAWRKLRRRVVATNDALIEEVFQSIQENPQFYTQFD